MKKIYVSDMSLQAIDDKQKLLFREKAAITSDLEKMGADSIELLEMKKMKEDSIIYKTIAASVKKAELVVPIGDCDPAECYESVKECEKTVLLVSLPVSTILMEYKCGLKEKALLERIKEKVSAASSVCDTEFCAEDATRAEKDFLINALKTAEEAGAKRVTVCDDNGDLIPSEISDLISYVCREVKVPVYFKPSNRLGLGLANTLSAISAGCSGIKTSVTGDKLVRTGDFAALWKEKGADLGFECSFDPTAVASICGKIEKASDSSSYSAFRNDSISGNTDEDIFIDQNSDINDVKKYSKMLGYELSEADLAKVYESLKQICEKKASIGKKELEAIIASSAMQVPSTYHLESYTINTGNLTKAMAYVCLTKNGEKLSGVTTGDGPVDSAFKAIDLAIGYHYELDDFQLQALTEGKESLGATIVKLRSSSGKLYSGNGISSDIVGAGIRAYLNALNKIVYEEEQ